MDINQELMRIAKEITATTYYKHQAYDYLTKAGFRPSEMQIQPKDRQRVIDINKKAGGNLSKAFSLVNQMANSIKDAEKAYRRGLAVLEYAEIPANQKDRFASSFFEKAINLG